MCGELTTFLCSLPVSSAAHHTRADEASRTVRVVLVSVAFDIISYAWKILAALSVASESTFDYWDARVFFPLSEGLMVLPSAIVVSVWMDVANSALSRSKVKQATFVRSNHNRPPILHRGLI